MDILSLSVGFLIGALTTAAGNYLGDKYTDKRRDGELSAAQAKIWQDIETRFPSVIGEMREDFSRPENQSIRTFFVKSSGTVIGIMSEPSFQYDNGEHPDIQAAVSYLLSKGFVTDITTANCPMYRVQESLIDWLKKPNHSSKRTREKPRAA